MKWEITPLISEVERLFVIVTKFTFSSFDSCVKLKMCLRVIRLILIERVTYLVNIENQ